MENSCRYFVCVDSFVHGELHGKELSDFEGHLGSCAECSKEIESLNGLRDSLTQAYSVSLDERFNYAVMSEIRKGRGAVPTREIRIALEDIIISFATLLVIVLIGIQLFHRPQISSVDMVGRLSRIEKSSLEQTNLSNDQVLELVLRNK